jgi:alkyl sulfatase BDS1-like metallo-beta-lactamase superfamily hydrolase
MAVHPTVAAQNARALSTLPFDDTQDVDDADRGFLGTIDPPVVRDATGRVVWDAASFDFVTGDAPESVHPSLWRQSGLVRRHGLYEVVPGIYQVRGLDLSNVTFVEGERGVLVIDPLISTECAAAALALYRRHRGDRPVTAVLYTHCHVDHFGGVKGVTKQQEVDAGEVVVIAPEGFVEHAVAENVYAGTAMGRRAAYMYGTPLERTPWGGVGAGLGQATSTGTVSLIVPTLTITRTGERQTVDGITMEFQMAPGTEAPAEMHVLFPDRAALCLAENATHTLHNLLTLRGALVRDPRIWSHYLSEAITLFRDRTDVVFASHHWPTWGRERAFDFVATQRDLYAYLHDQTLRMLNRGLTGPQLAEVLTLPPALERVWHTQGYYGSVSHNVKAIYQRYLGWYDGTCGRCRCRSRAAATSSGWAAPTPWSPARGRPSTTASCAGRRRCWTTWCSRSRTTRRRGPCSPTRTSSSASARRTAPGARSTCRRRTSCGTATSAPPPAPPRPTSWPSCPWTSCSTAWRSGSTRRGAGTTRSTSISCWAIPRARCGSACTTGCCCTTRRPTALRTRR